MLRAADNSLSPEKMRCFESDGFLAIPDLVPLSEVEMIRRTLMALHDQNVGYKEGAQFDALGSDDGKEPKRFPQIMQPSNYAPSLRKTEFHKLAGAMAREILGPNAKFIGDLSMMKPAGIGAATPWHQDEAFFDPNFDHQQVTFWLALQETDQSNGCMEFLPGSHKGPVLLHGHPGGDSRIHALECIDYFDLSKSVPCFLPAGGCTIHTARTLHGTKPNTSGQPRLAYLVLFDVVPTRRIIPQEFPWQRHQVTARAAREKAWRQRGGLLIYLWRRRSRVGFTNASYVLHAFWRAVTALRS